MDNEAATRAGNPRYARILVPLIWIGLVPLLFLLYPLFESAAAKVEGETRKCRTSMMINLTDDADKYCANALRFVASEGVTDSSAAEAYAQAALLAVVHKQFSQAAQYCRNAIPLWRDDPNPRFAQENARSIDKCRALIEDVIKARPAGLRPPDR
ncbi:MAG: hypothetical protein JWN73_5000 [Betaproteobacteria bacterium]|nr:hypothetical protein [Betaproteobacteria bacterium]